MTWTVHKEEGDKNIRLVSGGSGYTGPESIVDKLHVRAIIDLESEQDELKALIESLQKHVKED